MPSKRQLAKENQALRAEAERSKELLTFSIRTAEMGVLALAERLPLTKEDLKTLAEEFPQWSISCSTIEGNMDSDGRKVVKCFTRDISDLRPELRRDDETYKRLADAEHFDWDLRQAFKNASPEDVGWISGDGTFGGLHPNFYGHIDIEIEGESSITKLDLIRIKAAEQYLEGQNLFAEPIAA